MSTNVKLIFDGRKTDDYGIGTYIKNIFGGLIGSGKFDYKFLHLKNSSYLKQTVDNIIEIGSKNYSPLEHFQIPLKIKNFKKYIYFSPHYVYPLFIKNRLIVTVHDLIHFKFPEFFPPYKREIGKYFIKKIKQRSEIVFTVSNQSKIDLIDMFGFKEEKIKVIYNGISDIFFSYKKIKTQTKPPYILYIGNLKPHKNLKILLKSFSNIKNKYKDLKLILIGIKDRSQVNKTIMDLKIENRVIIKGYLKQEELISFIDNSLFFVFPSIYEGFGLPPLEVMARGKAVVSSSGGSLKEILKDNAILFNPYSEEELTTILEDMIIDDSLRKEYENRSKIYSENFHWKTFINQYIEILKGF